jgi:GrpB-like predicted nucleotidyltransferase (UPF0157 family)
LVDESRPLGLRRGLVRVVSHQERWQEAFEDERRLLGQCLGALAVDIQHVGSTSVPGLEAKPVIDIAVALAMPLDLHECRKRLCGLGYLDRGDFGADGGYLFVKEREPNVRTHHLHVVTIDDPQWGAYLRFRDMLRADAQLRARYAALKQTLEARYPEDRKGYTNGKASFIKQVLER